MCGVKLNHNTLKDRAFWQNAGVALPDYDPERVLRQTLNRPVWLHFGAGNIFRGYIAALADRLLCEGETNVGVIAAETFDEQIISDIYTPHDSLALLVTLRADGTREKRVIAGAVRGYAADRDFVIIKDIFCSPSLQMVSLTVTEKGYAIHDGYGGLLEQVACDAKNGPGHPVHIMAVLAALLFARYQSGGAPLALVSMDNCSENGSRLKAAITAVADRWAQAGYVDKGFTAYLADPARVSFPWSMIDKITPRPATEISEELTGLGIEDMQPLRTEKGTCIAPFVNAEQAQYLVIEDTFPAGRPPLERAGVYFADRDTVARVERMKVCTCLNPLHTALAVFGCLLGYTRISDEMRDEQLSELVRRIGYDEGLPVVTDPGILDPRAFLDEVITQRLPNPFIPDTPQRIACDTSQKIPIRFGQTIKAYMASPGLRASRLIYIPLALAGWLRYLLGVDDALMPMQVSPDPMLKELQRLLGGVVPAKPETAKGKLEPLLHNAALFGTDLYAAGLAPRIERMFTSMLRGEGAVRATLKEWLQQPER